MSCQYCGGAQRFQVVSPVSDHAWADCFCKGLNKVSVRTMLLQMFRGWIIHENSFVRNPEWDELMGKVEAGTATDEDREQLMYIESGKYSKDPEIAMIEAVGEENHLYGYLLNLFGHWSNDIQSVAAHYGIGLDRVDNKLVLIDVPPAPSEDHWWNSESKEWIEPEGPIDAPELEEA